MRFLPKNTRVAFGLTYLLIKLFYMTGASRVTLLPKFIGCELITKFSYPLYFARARVSHEACSISKISWLDAPRIYFKTHIF